MPATTSAAPTGLYAWLMQYGAMVQFFAQIIFWFGILILLAYAVVQYKRYVNYIMGVGKSGQLRLEQEAAWLADADVLEDVEMDAASGEDDKKNEASVDEFVE